MKNILIELFREKSKLDWFNYAGDKKMESLKDMHFYLDLEQWLIEAIKSDRLSVLDDVEKRFRKNQSEYKNDETALDYSLEELKDEYGR